MRGHYRFALVVGLVAFVVTACAPAVTVHPKEYVTNLAYSDAYQDAVKAINTEPYSSTTGGWVITQSDQVGGFVTAQMNGLTKCVIFRGCRSYSARVSVTLVKRSDGKTTVSISGTNDKPAERLIAHLIDALEVTPIGDAGNSSG